METEIVGYHWLRARGITESDITGYRERPVGTLNLTGCHVGQLGYTNYACFVDTISCTTTKCAASYSQWNLLPSRRILPPCWSVFPNRNITSLTIRRLYVGFFSWPDTSSSQLDAFLPLCSHSRPLSFSHFPKLSHIHFEDR